MRTTVVSDISEIPAVAWDALAGEDDPFVEHAFLRALEASGSVGGESGWSPMHVVAHDARGVLVGALPLYAKTHSYGEYIFDWGWANAAHRAGLPYYPKLVSMVPFTPAGARRFLTAPDGDRVALLHTLVGAVREAARALSASSIHLDYIAEDERRVAALHGFVGRTTTQFHFVNAGYETLDALLSTFRSKTRKEAKRERAKAASSGLEIVTREGRELRARDWEALERFYRDTCDRKGNEAYLTPAFFDHVRRTHAHRVVAVLALGADGAPVAGTLNFEKGRHLYGRYWGADAAYDSLHFELCYWRLLERTIARGHARFEAGAQGLHKLRRGLLPHAIHSAHWIEHPGLRAAVAASLVRESAAVRTEMEMLAHHGPFRRGGKRDSE
jgi:hypothetical protein